MEASASSLCSPIITTLSFTDHFISRRVPLPVGDDGVPLMPVELRAHIERPLELIKAAVSIHAFQLHGSTRHRPKPLPPLPQTRAAFSPATVTRARVMFGCAAAVCQRLVATPADASVTPRTKCVWVESVVRRVARGSAGKIEVHALAALALVVPVTHAAAITRQLAGQHHAPHVQGCHTHTRRRSRLVPGCCSCPRSWPNRFYGGTGRQHRASLFAPCKLLQMQEPPSRET
jgi:hypothetical protein